MTITCPRKCGSRVVGVFPRWLALRRLTGKFVRGDDRGLAIAGQIEVGLEQAFGDEEPYASFALALA